MFRNYFNFSLIQQIDIKIFLEWFLLLLNLYKQASWSNFLKTLMKIRILAGKTKFAIICFNSNEMNQTNN